MTDTSPIYILIQSGKIRVSDTKYTTYCLNDIQIEVSTTGSSIEEIIINIYDGTSSIITHDASSLDDLVTEVDWGTHIGTLSLDPLKKICFDATGLSDQNVVRAEVFLGLYITVLTVLTRSLTEFSNPAIVEFWGIKADPCLVKKILLPLMVAGSFSLSMLDSNTILEMVNFLQIVNICSCKDTVGSTLANVILCNYLVQQPALIEDELAEEVFTTFPQLSNIITLLCKNKKDKCCDNSKYIIGDCHPDPYALYLDETAHETAAAIQAVKYDLCNTIKGLECKIRKLESYIKELNNKIYCLSKKDIIC